MTVNRGKDFETQIKKGFDEVPDTMCIRLIDPQNGYAGVRNICDFIVYHKPYMYLIECKSVHGNRMSIHSNDTKRKYGALTNAQWEGLLEASKIPGVIAGVIVWFIDHDVTYFLPIELLECLYEDDYKSVAYYPEWAIIHTNFNFHYIMGKKRRVFFDYDMTEFFRDIEEEVSEFDAGS